MAGLRLDRTMCFVKEPRKQRDGGGIRLKRIPWDLISVEGKGFLVSPVPIRMGDASDAKVQTAAYIKSLDDLLYNELSDVSEIDPIVGIAFFASEADFYAKFEGSFGMYNSDGAAGAVSAEFGYPRT